MYGIFTYMKTIKNQPNVGKYSSSMEHLGKGVPCPWESPWVHHPLQHDSIQAGAVIASFSFTDWATGTAEEGDEAETFLWRLNWSSLGPPLIGFS